MLSSGYRYAFEFRDGSWYSTKILTALSDFGIALCISDHRDAPSPWEATARHAYVRAHGPGGHYRGRYSKSVLRRWVRTFDRWNRNGVTVYCYFDNDQKSAAPRDALELLTNARSTSARTRSTSPAFSSS